MLQPLLTDIQSQLVREEKQALADMQHALADLDAPATIP